MDNGGRLLKVPTFWRELIVKFSLKKAGRLSTQKVVESSFIMEGTLDNVYQVSADVKGRWRKKKQVPASSGLIFQLSVGLDH